MKKEAEIDDVRRENTFYLMSMHGGTVSSLSKKCGVNRSTLSSMLHGRTITDRIARDIEMGCDKTFGWLDKEHFIREVPDYDKTVLRAVINCIHSVKGISNMYAELGVEGKTDLFDKLYNVFVDPAARDLAPSTLVTLLEGSENETKKATRKNKHKTR